MNDEYLMEMEEAELIEQERARERAIARARDHRLNRLYGEDDTDDSYDSYDPDDEIITTKYFAKRSIEDKNKVKRAVLKLFEERIDNYIPSFSFLTEFQIEKFMKKCYDKVQHESYSITVNYKYKNDSRYFPFIFFLTKTQNKNNNKARKNESKYTITFSGNHFKKTCKQTLDLNSRFNMLLNYRSFLSPTDVKKLKKDIKKKEEIIFNTRRFNPNDSNDPYIDILMNEINEIKEKLERNENPSFQSREFTNLDNTPKKTSLKQVKIDNTLSQKDFFKIYNITEIKPYFPFPVYMDNQNVKKFFDYGDKIIQNYPNEEKNDLILKLSLNNFNKEGTLMILYLTKSQIKTLKDIPRQKFFKKNKKTYFKDIKFSKKQIFKTYLKTRQINAQLTRDRNSKVKQKDLLRRAYTINKDLIELIDDDPAPIEDLITFDDKNLIDLETEIPNPKVIPSYGRNILRSLLVSDKVTKTFGKVLTPNLDKAISKLNTEISSGLYHIINGIIKNIKTNKVSINKIRYFKDLITQFIYSISNNI